MQIAVIELSEKVVIELMERSLVSIDLEHLPFKDFSIKFPTYVFLSKEQVVEDILAELARRKERVDDTARESINLMASEYINADLTVSFRHDGTSYHVEIKDIHNGELFSFTVNTLVYIPYILENKFTTNAPLFAVKIIKLINNLIQHILSPTETIYVTKRSECIVTSKGNKKVKKTYITKKNYVVKDIETSIHKRDYNRIRESWGVRAHWRKYKTGKEIWVNSYTKGVKKESDIKEYKVTKL